MCKKPSTVLLLCIPVMGENGNDRIGGCENAVRLKGSTDYDQAPPLTTKEVSSIYLKDVPLH